MHDDSVDAATPGVTPPNPTSSTPTEPLAQALTRLARGVPTDLTGLLHDVESHAVVDGTKVTAHCHCLKLDGNGRPRIEALVKVVAEHVLDYAIPRTQIREADEEYARTRSSQKLVRLVTEAKALFTDLAQSGEGGELLLFALAERILRLPQLICKMSLKTNTRMHVHGADGLHAGVDEATGKLLLYWGESKIYGDVTGAVRECLASVAPMLAEHAAGQRDLHLLQRHADLDSPALEAALKQFLDPDSEHFNSVEFRGLCLVGFDCDAYPEGPSDAEVAALAKQIGTTLPAWKGHVKRRIAEEKLDAFAMHFLFVPFPSADAFRQLLRDELGVVTHAATVTTTTAPAAQPTAAAAHAARAHRATPNPKAASRQPRASKPKRTPRGTA